MLHLTKILNVKYPIIQGGMGNISNATLTAAVSDAGGLGTIGCGTMTPAEVEQIILETKEKTNKPFAVNVAITVTPFLDEIIDLIIKHEIPIVSLSAGNPAKIIPVLHQHGIKVIAVVASVKHARKAEEAKADVLVAEGYEAAGINSSLEITTFALIPQIAAAVSIPVVAAGGIGNGQGLAAALMLGASGVQMGTRLIATKEAPFHEIYKQKLIDAKDIDTVIIGRSIGKVRRVLNTEYSENILRLEEENRLTLQSYQELTSEKQHHIGAIQGDLANGFINSGQIAGLIDAVPSVEELIERMMKEAKESITGALKAFELVNV